jgi:hypothetical protein
MTDPDYSVIVSHEATAFDTAEDIYRRVARLFAERIDALFASEETLKAQFESLFPKLPFDRTEHWGGIIWKVFRDCWLEAGPAVKGEPTGYDRNSVLRLLAPLLDYSLFTQVLLNLQSYAGMAYQARDAEADIQKLQDEWPKDSKLKPFEPKARMIKEAAAEEEKRYNLTLSTLRSLRIISGFTPQISFRVSPKGSTPALADSNNISSLGIGADRYLKVLPGLKAFYISWAPGTGAVMAFIPAACSDHVTFQAEGIPYLFRSTSGGDILQQVLFARRVAYGVFLAHDVVREACIILPRMSSVLTVSDEKGESVRRAFEGLRAAYPFLEFSEGTRG